MRLTASPRAAQAIEEYLRAYAETRRRDREAVVYREVPDIVDWAATHYLIDTPDGVKPIALFPHQAAILRYFFQTREDGRFRFRTLIYSTVKKSGKTEIGALIARWAMETWGRFLEIYALANDFEQAQGRNYQAVSDSLRLDPAYDAQRKLIPGKYRVLDKAIYHLPSGSFMRAVANDYAGAAGSNPALTVFTELWAYTSQNSKRLWTETTPSPTAFRSVRLVETYAGYTGESDLLESLYETATKAEHGARQLTAGELADVTGCALGVFEEATQRDDPVPIYVNESAGICAYWDEGPQARRMPWQKGEVGEAYYREQAATLPGNEFLRIHENRWIGAESDFVPIEWWDACGDPDLPPLEPPPPGYTGRRPKLVVMVDASVSGDSTALVVVQRHPRLHDHVAERLTRIWVPSQETGGKMDYHQTVTPTIDWLVTNFDVIEVGYDPYQLHQWANDMRQREPTRNTWFREFSQGVDRLLADKTLYDVIRDRRLHHTRNRELRQHIQNCAAKLQKGEDSKLRLVKKGELKRIDGAVALSMAVHECLRLDL